MMGRQMEIDEARYEPVEQYRLVGVGMMTIGPKDLELFEAVEWLRRKRGAYPTAGLRLQVRHGDEWQPVGDPGPEVGT